MNIEKEIGEINTSVKSAHKRIDELQSVTKAFYELTATVKVMANEMIAMKSDVSDIKLTMENYHVNQPNKLIMNVKTSIITTICGAIIGAIMTFILK